MATAISLQASDSTLVERSQPRPLAPAWRWLILIAGAIMLAGGPAALDLFSLSRTATWIMAVTFGFAMASALSPSLILAVCAVLSWRPVWQRCLFFAPAFALQIVSYLLFWCDGAPSDRSRTAILLSPLVIMAAASPAFLLRLWRQWVVAPKDNPIQAKPASIISLLLATTCWAAAAACTQSIRADGGGLWGESDLQDEPGLEAFAKLLAAFVYLMIPAGFMGLSLVLLLRAALVRSPRRACFALSIVAIATLASAVGLVVALVRLTFQVNNGPPSATDLLGAALGVGSFCLTMLAIGLTSFVTLRLLGYRVIHRGSLLESR
jgi:MFS family permease